LKVLDKHIAQLGTSRNLLQMIRYQDGFQTPTVASELVKVKGVIERLVTVVEPLATSHSSQDSLNQLSNVMDELEKATVNLQGILPGNVFSSSDNTGKDAVQILSVFGGKAPDGRISVFSSGNKVDGGIQTAGPVFGEASASGLIGLATLLAQKKRT
jgi:hypothetical protein